MTKPLEALIAEMKAASEKATPGEWWSDVVETGGSHGNGEDCMEGFNSYAVYDQNNHSLLDMTNSTAAVVSVEDDGDYVTAWDEVARRNAEFIALVNPANTLALIAALEQTEGSRAHLLHLLASNEKAFEQYQSQSKSRIAELIAALEQLQQQNAEPLPDNRNMLIPALEGLSRERLIATVQTVVDKYSLLHKQWLDDCKRIAELETSQSAVKLPAGTEINGFHMLVEAEVVARLREAGINAEVFRTPNATAGITVQGDE